MYQLHRTLKRMQIVVPMISVVLKNLCRGFATRLYPAERRQPFAGVRGSLRNDAATCILCGTCARICPSQCITVSRQEQRWQYDPSACVFCGVCSEACPVGSLRMLVERLPVSSKKERVLLRVLKKK